jgi:hypothetical protein
MTQRFDTVACAALIATDKDECRNDPSFCVGVVHYDWSVYFFLCDRMEIKMKIACTLVPELIWNPNHDNRALSSLHLLILFHVLT